MGRPSVMTCDSCDANAHRLHYCGQDGFLCQPCEAAIVGRPKSFRKNLLHQNAGNKHAPKMTVVEKMNIVTRRIGPDGIARPARQYDSNHY